MPRMIGLPLARTALATCIFADSGKFYLLFAPGSELETDSRNKRLMATKGREGSRPTFRNGGRVRTMMKFATDKIERARISTRFSDLSRRRANSVHATRLQPLDRLNVPDEGSILVETSYDSHLCPCKLH